MSSGAAVAAARIFGVRVGAPASEWLGLGTTTQDEALVFGAMRERLAMVNAEADLPAEVQDELRERLHAAARDALAPTISVDEQSALPTVVLPSTTPEPTAGSRSSNETERAQLRIAIRQILAAEGGFTPLAMMRLAQLAKLHGMEPETLTAIAKEAGGMRPESSGRVPEAVARPRAAAETSRQVRREKREAAGRAERDALGEEVPFANFAGAEAEAERWNRKLKIAVLGGGVGLAALAAGLIVLGLLLSKPAGGVANGAGGEARGLAVAESKSTNTSAGGSAALGEAMPRDATGPKSAAESDPPIGETLAPARDPLDSATWGDLVRELRACNANAKNDPQQAVVAAEPIVKRMSGNWTKADTGGLVAATTAIVELAYSVSNDSEAGARFVEVLAVRSAGERPRAEEIPRIVFGAGTISRLARETEFPSSLNSAVRRALTTILGANVSARELSFDSGARAGLSRIMPMLIPPSETASEAAGTASGRWRAWSECVAAVEGAGSDSFEAVMIRALGMMLTDAPDPATNRGSYESIGELTTTLAWRKGSPARGALLGWLTDPAVAASDLHAMTAALATRSSAEGVDSSMILSLAANAAQRAELRERFATVWGFSVDAGRAEVFAAWAKVGEPFFDAELDPNPLLVLSQAVILARLNATAAMLWSGESGAIPSDLAVLDTAAARQVGALDPNVGKIVLVGGGDEAWAVQYLKVGENIPIRRELLARFAAEPDALSAAVLVREACRGTPTEVRVAAQELVRRYSTSVEIMNAMLDIAPLAPATREVSDLVRDLTFTQMPSVRSSAWRFAARRALVERLLQRVAEAGEFAAVETFAASLAGAIESDPLTRSVAKDAVQPMVDQGVTPSEYEERAPDPAAASSPAVPTTVSGPAPGDPAMLDMLAARRFAALERQARSLIPSGLEPKTIAEITGSMNARLGIGSGPVQSFAARQFASAEMLGFAIVAERPSRASAVIAVLRGMHESRLDAKHVFLQVHAAERAMALLWRLRLTENPA